MREIGELLRRTREQKGISLEEAEKATKIRRRYLEAMEKGNFACPPERVYARGFLRSYARFLGLDASLLLEQFKDGPEARKGETPANSSRPVAPAKTKAVSARRWRLRRLLAALVVVALLGVIVPVWLVPVWSPPAGSGGVVDAPATTGQGPPQAPGPAAPAATTPRQGLSLEILAAQGPCWLAVTADGQAVYEALLPQGKEVSFTARESIRVKFGDAGAVRVKLNGQDLGPVGNRGEVLRKEFRVPAP
ncbi:MAG: helix-turn-helix domain-containing protein [Clostridia bacterium]|nr:helix-turn-helix domain-containing protein [Clostridia bacterium]